MKVYFSVRNKDNKKILIFKHLQLFILNINKNVGNPLKLVMFMLNSKVRLGID